MSSTPFRRRSLDAALDRTAFASGSEPLDRYFREQVALADGERIAGYYTLASARVLLEQLPATTAKKLPRYPTVPAVRLGRLAVDQAFKGQGLGGALLADGLDRAARAEIAAYALLVDAKDESAAAFYGHHGFIALQDSKQSLFLPLATAMTARKLAI